MTDSISTWQEYRKRRAFLALGIPISIVALVVLYTVDAPLSVKVLFWIAAPLHMVFAGIWLGSFHCPACAHDWFGGERGDSRPRGFIAFVLAMFAQKICGHCGLPKFMDPAD